MLTWRFLQNFKFFGVFDTGILKFRHIEAVAGLLNLRHFESNFRKVKLFEPSYHKSSFISGSFEFDLWISGNREFPVGWLFALHKNDPRAGFEKNIRNAQNRAVQNGVEAAEKKKTKTQTRGPDTKSRCVGG